MTKAISMAIELDQDIMVTNMCLKFGEDWTNSFQELDRKQSSGHTLWGHKCRLYLISLTTEHRNFFPIYIKKHHYFSWHLFFQFEQHIADWFQHNKQKKHKRWNDYHVVKGIDELYT